MNGVGRAHAHEALQTVPSPRRQLRPRWAYWLSAAAVLAWVLYLFFLLPSPDARVILVPTATAVAAGG